MAASRAIIDFVEFMEHFRQQENNERGATLDEQVDSLLSANGQSLKGRLIVDRSPSGEAEFLVFDALVGGNELIFGRTFDASDIPPLLSRIEKGTLEMVTLGGMSLSGPLATAMFKTMLNIGFEWFSIYLREDYGREVILAFQHFLQESSIHFLSLCSHTDEWISIEALRSICTGILNSSVKLLRLGGIKVRGNNVERQVHEILAEIILDSSSSIELILVAASNAAGDSSISLQLLSRALCQHPVIQNLDVSFRVDSHDGDQDDALVFDRNPWWKRLLAMDDLPLQLWPLLLTKADTWKRESSHSHLDVLNFLLREKNTQLLQNVRRRRIRKRKRYGFSA